MSDYRYPDHLKPRVNLKDIRKRSRSRSPQERRTYSKRQHIPSARVDNYHRPIKREDSYRHGRGRDHRQSSRNTFQPSSRDRYQRPPSATDMEAEAEQTARRMVSNPSLIIHYPKIPPMDIDTTMTLLNISREAAQDKQYEHFRRHLLKNLEEKHNPSPANHHDQQRRTSREESPRRRNTRSTSRSPGGLD